MLWIVFGVLLVIVAEDVFTIGISTGLMTPASLKIYAPATEFLNRTLGPARSHLSVVPVGRSIHAVATLDCSADEARSYEVSLRNLLAINEGRGDQLLVLQGKAPQESPFSDDMVWAALIETAASAYIYLGLRRRFKILSPHRGAPEPRPILDGAREAAIVAMSHPPEFSARLFKYLGPQAVQQLTDAITGLPQISPAMRDEVLTTFNAYLAKVTRQSGTNVAGLSEDERARAMAILLHFYLRALKSADKELPTLETVPGLPSPPVNRRRQALALFAVALSLIALQANLKERVRQSTSGRMSDLLQHDLQSLTAGPVAVEMVRRNNALATSIAVVGASPEQLAGFRKVVRTRMQDLGLDTDRLSLISTDSQPKTELPWLTMLVIGVNLSGLLSRRRRKAVVSPEAVPTPALSPIKRASAADPICDPIAFEVGRELLCLVDPNRGAKILERVDEVRKAIKRELGLTVPGVRFRVNRRLEGGGYRILFGEAVVAQGIARPDLRLAIGPNDKLDTLIGEHTVDPTYGLPAVWFDPKEKEAVERQGCMIFDAVSILGCHLTHCIRERAAELFTFKAALNLCREPEIQHLVTELIPRRLDSVTVWLILRNLLAECVPIVNRVRIFEVLLERSSETNDPLQLTELVRQSLAGQIIDEYATDNAEKTGRELHVWALPEALEALLRQESPENRSQITGAAYQALVDAGGFPVVVTLPELRLRLRRIFNPHSAPVVLSTAELDAALGARITIVRH